MARILVIDDSEKSRELVKTLLVDLDHEVFLSADAFSAMDYLDKYRFDLILLDLNMPNKTGFSFLQELRARISHRHVAVAIMTGRRNENDVKRAIKLDALTYIVKPFTPTEFKERIKGLLANIKTRSAAEKEIPLHVERAKAVVHLNFEARIIKVLETGLVIMSNKVLKENQQVMMNSPLFTDIGIDSPMLSVHSVKSVNDLFQINLVFNGLSPESTSNVKNWLLSNAFGV